VIQRLGAATRRWFGGPEGGLFFIVPFVRGTGWSQWTASRCVIAYLSRLLRTDRLPKTIEWPHRRSRRRKRGMDHGYRVQAIELLNLRTADGIRCPPVWNPELRGVCGRRAAARRDGSSPLDHERLGLRGKGNLEDDRIGRLGPGGWPAAQSRRVEVEGAFDRGRCPVKSLLRRWNCRNCGRSNETLVAANGTAKCEYCTDVAEVRPLHSWGQRLFRFASSLLSSLTNESGCLHWRLIPAPARTWRPNR
jgi:hypothetical protein